MALDTQSEDLKERLGKVLSSVMDGLVAQTAAREEGEGMARDAKVRFQDPPISDSFRAVFEPFLAHLFDSSFGRACVQRCLEVRFFTEFCIKNDEFCIKNDAFCIKNDAF